MIRTIRYDADGKKISEDTETPDGDRHERRKPSLFKQVRDEWKGKQRRPAMSPTRWDLLFK